MSTIKVNRFENTAGVVYGCVLQTVNTLTGAVATGTTTIPYDDTIPQNTEGDQYMSLAITPKSATSKLKISVTVQASASTNAAVIAALFQDTKAFALATAYTSPYIATAEANLSFTYYMTAGTTSATTFRVRIGPSSAATLTFNGAGGARTMGGSLASSITIEEIQV